MTTASAKALRNVDELMSIIDNFDIDNVSVSTNIHSHHNHTVNHNNTSRPTFDTFASQAPADIAYRPSLPPGHTWYSWSFFNQFDSDAIKQTFEDQSVAIVNAPPKQRKTRSPKQKKKQQRQQQQPQPKKHQQKKPRTQKKKTKRRIVAKGLKIKSAEESKEDGGVDEDVHFEKRDHLLDIESKIQQKWSDAKVFEAVPNPGQEKFMVTFPYPYMNGYLHLGHAFTLTKAEFRAGYERMQGKNVLFPFAFHCTGMPIAAAALKIKEEIDFYGNPPVFPTHHDIAADESADPNAKHKHAKAHAKKSKHKYQWEIMQDFGLTDSEIAKFADPLAWLHFFPPIGMTHLKRFGLKADWRRSFITTAANPYYSKFIEWQFHILKNTNKIAFGNRPTVFSPKENQPCADHDRSEGENVTPQEYTIIKMELICDNDALVRNCPSIQKNGDKLASLYARNTKIYLVAATLRPETMYGQTNCFVLPRGAYFAIETCKKDDQLEVIPGSEEIFICSEHSARNLAWQNFTAKLGEYTVLAKLEGWDLLGRAVKAPNAVYDYVFVYPLLTIKMDKGTGIVTSVPSDAPADYAALRDAQKDESFRAKYYLEKYMVEPFDVVDIIYIPEFESNRSAVDLCEQAGVQSQTDVTILEEIKLKVYKYGFNHGTMLVGPFKGERVNVAKAKCQQQLVAANLAAVYLEPESLVVSRTGCKCVVAYVDQWFLKYGAEQSPEWQSAVEQHMQQGLECFNHVTKDQFIYVVNWLQSWACSREFGLGTALPWDTKWVIESLSDSTIYMAFYTVAHLLLDGSLDGNAAHNAIQPAELTMDVFDAIFLAKEVDFDSNNNGGGITNALIRQCRKEFEYWYPMDLRVSGKDLIFNHLTMSIYNHAAIWPNSSETRWPQGFFCNGHVMIDAAKMSKSTGNFMTMIESCDLYSADATRLALADAGDSLEDANFSHSVANSAVLKLSRLENFAMEVHETLDQMRTGAFNDLDKMFDNEMNRAVLDSDHAYKSMKFRDALTSGFYILERARDYYRTHVHNGVHRDLMSKYIDIQLLVICPISPHICEFVWNKIHPELGMIVNNKWPECPPSNHVLTHQFEFIQETSHNFRQAFAKAESDRRRKQSRNKKSTADADTPVNSAVVCVADDYKVWQKHVIRTLGRLYDETSNSMPDSFKKEVLLDQRTHCAPAEEDNDDDTADANANTNNNNNNNGKKKKKKKKSKQNQQIQKVMQFASFLVNNVMPNRKKNTFNEELLFNEYEFVTTHTELLFHAVEIDLNNVTFYRESDETAPAFVRERTMPGHPAIRYAYIEPTAK